MKINTELWLAGVMVINHRPFMQRVVSRKLGVPPDTLDPLTSIEIAQMFVQRDSWRRDARWLARLMKRSPALGAVLREAKSYLTRLYRRSTVETWAVSFGAVCERLGLDPYTVAAYLRETCTRAPVWAVTTEPIEMLSRWHLSREHQDNLRMIEGWEYNSLRFDGVVQVRQGQLMRDGQIVRERLNREDVIEIVQEAVSNDVPGEPNHPGRWPYGPAPF